MSEQIDWKKGDQAKFYTAKQGVPLVTLTRGPDRAFSRITDQAHGDAWHVTTDNGDRLVAYTSELAKVDDFSPWVPFRCDHCRLPLTRDRNGYWVGPDKTSDCGKHERGHMIEGEIRS